jgi:hypothetical protein
MDSRKEKDTAIEIGKFYAIIGKDGRECNVEIRRLELQDLKPLE